MSVSNRDIKFLVTLEVDYELPERYKDKVKMYWYFPFINEYDFSANKTVLRGGGGSSGQHASYSVILARSLEVLPY